MKEAKTFFFRKELDSLLQDVLTGEVSEKQRSILMKALISDVSLRESFCDLIKDLRLDSKEVKHEEL